MNHGQNRLSGQLAIAMSDDGVNHFQESQLRGHQDDGIVTVGEQRLEEASIPAERLFQAAQPGIFGFELVDAVAQLVERKVGGRLLGSGLR